MPCSAADNSTGRSWSSLYRFPSLRRYSVSAPKKPLVTSWTTNGCSKQDLHVFHLHSVQLYLKSVAVLCFLHRLHSPASSRYISLHSQSRSCRSRSRSRAWFQVEVALVDIR